MNESALFIAVFLACAVEAVEATTIVLAAGTARDWRSALLGAGGALVVLAVIVGVAGPAISILPIDALRLVVGGLLLVFGLQWIRKAILRSSGYKALHDEDAIYQKEFAIARAAAQETRGGVRDWFAFTLSFKGVLLEGLEVVFIVLTFGTIQHNVGLASIAATIAVILVAILGFSVRKPLARIPENTMKFIVGIMLTSFGIFWGAEGAGAGWPGADLALLAVVAGVAIVSLLLVALLRRRYRRRDVLVSAGGFVEPVELATADGQVEPALLGDPPHSANAAGPSDVGAARRRTFGAGLVAFGTFWYDFIFGDDWQLTIGIVIAFALTFWLSTAGVVSWWLVPAAVLLLLLPYGLARAIRGRS
jgi:uncharacterized membrane protein